MNRVYVQRMFPNLCMLVWKAGSEERKLERALYRYELGRTIWIVKARRGPDEA